MKIESLSRFDEFSIFNETPNLVKLLIGRSSENAKSYMYKNISPDIYNSTIVLFGEYTLEAIIIYVLGCLFHSIKESSVVRVSKLIDVLDRTVRSQADIIKKVKGSTAVSRQVDGCKEGLNGGYKYEIGRKLLDFMIKRDVIRIETLKANDQKAVVKKRGSAHLETNLFAVCNFDLRMLPLKLHLPMVCEPIDWKHPMDMEIKFDYPTRKPLLLSDLRGGYLSCLTIELYHGDGLLSSPNLSHFNIELEEHNYKEMCSILNGLQRQGLQINKRMLEFIRKNRQTLERVGLLMPGILARVNMSEALDLMRISYYDDDTIKSACSLSDLLKELSLRVQRARYEDLIIKLVSAYEDYVFYLPAFMDFRGRIYRSGMLNFHERDLVRSLIVFAHNGVEEVGSSREIVALNAAFKYRKFDRDCEALQWYEERESLIHASEESLIEFAKDAEDPFQFMVRALSHDVSQECSKIPITQDAAASAYQIMSYLLLNEEMARSTNLIPNPDGKIEDVYMHLCQDLREFLSHRIDDRSKRVIESKFDRGLTKRLFMPLIYGKTLISMGSDIRQTYGPLLSQKDSFNLAKLCMEFWNNKYPDLVNLMKLITIISLLCAVKDRAVVYKVPYFTTRQDYMSFVREVITIYERRTSKRRRVTLKVPTVNRDSRKTKSSTCANFIHQKDAYIAMRMVDFLLSEGADIYTVHDNFITTLHYVRSVPDLYTKVFIEMGPPLSIINEFIKDNLIHPYYHDQDVNNIPPIYYHCNHNPMPSDHLREFLNSITPAKGKKKWQMKVSDLISYYNSYVDTVCGRQVTDSELPSPDVKWSRFSALMENVGPKFCVHY
jgi:DNA-directed RNA polymerase